MNMEGISLGDFTPDLATEVLQAEDGRDVCLANSHYIVWLQTDSKQGTNHNQIVLLICL